MYTTGGPDLTRGHSQLEVVVDSKGEDDLQTAEHADAATESAIAAVLEAHRGERHLIVLQDFPDPDAISSAYAHQLISASFGIEADIIYAGRISHQQNVALVKLLGITLIRYDKSMKLDDYAGAVFVDNQGTTAGTIVDALEAANVPPLIIVDHHEAQGRLDAKFCDIRRIGATASIYAGYLEQGLIRMDKAHHEHVMLATALMHGIITDTVSFATARADDFHAAAFLSRYRDVDLLEQIMNQARSKQTMEMIRRALGNRVIVESFSIAGIGYLRAEDRDAIPQAADFLLTEENVHTAIVYGIVIGDDRQESLAGSLRTIKLTLDPDEFLKEVVGKDTAGRAFGGGRLSAGGFEVPVGFLSNGHRDDGPKRDEFRELKWQVFDAQMKQKIFAKIGVEQKAHVENPPHPSLR
jgi:nanoRNase/pAp phosphatase (c-di-AMP/oligoRNAs hydrolase)